MTTPSSQPRSPSRLARLGEVCGVTFVTAVVCAVPSALRTREAGGALLDGWVVALAVLFCGLLPVLLLVPRAARGLRGVTGGAPSPTIGVWLALWISSSLLALFALAALLKLRTHHRGLGGATFGMFGAALLALCAVAAARCVALGRWLRERKVPRWLLSVVVVLVVLAPVGLMGVALSSGAAEGAVSATRAASFDALLALAVLLLLSIRRLPEALLRLFRVAAAPLSLCLVVLGVVRLETADMGPMRRGGGLPATVLKALEGWTDRDGDGVGSHFGGRDCDEGDAQRRPGRVDTPGDNLDSDCDGSDGPAELAVAEKVPEVQPPAPAPAGGTSSPAGSDATVTASAPKPQAKPDIVLVTLDTVRADRTSLYGYNKDTTPRLRALAERGMVFEHAYATGSDTQGALVPVLSGRWYLDTPHTAKEWPRIRDEAELIAERLKGEGYATGAVVSFTWLRKGRGFAQGFDVFDESSWNNRHPERESTGEEAVKAAIALHRKLSSSQAPLFLWLHLFDAHAKYVEHPGIDFGRGASGFYDGEIAFVDKQLGVFIDAVAASPRAEQTSWLIHGSHGEAFGEHGQSGHGTHLYDEMLRVPLVIVAPGVAPGRYGDGAVSTLDIVPTLLDYAGIDGGALPGVSLRPAVEGKPLKRPPVWARVGGRVAIIDWPFKLIASRRQDRPDRLLLFDLVADPGERQDASQDKREELRRLDALRKKASKAR